jgi:hypothetical protein
MQKIVQHPFISVKNTLQKQQHHFYLATFPHYSQEKKYSFMIIDIRENSRFTKRFRRSHTISHNEKNDTNRVFNTLNFKTPIA